MAISSPGVGSNLDVNSIVSQLMGIERQPISVLDQKEASFQAKLSAYGTLKGALSTFQNSVRALSDISKFQALSATPSDATIFSASASSQAVAGSYSVTATQLAQAQKLSSAGFANATDTVGTGTITIAYGTTSGAVFTANTTKAAQTVTIDAAHSSLSGIRDAINAANINVTATIINDGSVGTPNKLVLTSKDTGADNSLKITVADTTDASDIDNAGLSQLAYDPAGGAGTGKNLTQTIAAQNALLTVDGITGISKSSNIITDVVQGVTLTLVKAGTSSLTVTRDTASVQAAVGAFVNAYNAINKSVVDLTAYNSTTKTGALLQGDAAARSIQNQIRSVVSSSVTALGGNLTLLSQVGVSFQKDGTLALDATKLQTAITNNFNDIAGLFAAVGKPSDSLINYNSATTNTKAGSFAVNISTLASRGTAVGGAAIGSYTITAGVDDGLTLTVDGIVASVTLAAGTYTATSLAAELQTKINGVSALSSVNLSVNATISAGNVVTLTSNTYGSASNVSVTGGTGQTNLGFATAANTVGSNVVGTINGFGATGVGQYLTGGTGNDAEGLKIQITGGATGARGTLAFSRGYANQLDKLVDSLLSSNGPITSRTSGISASINSISNQRTALNRRLVDVEKRYRAQFTALDMVMGQLTRTSSFLTQQLASLNTGT